MVNVSSAIFELARSILASVHLFVVIVSVLPLSGIKLKGLPAIAINFCISAALLFSADADNLLVAGISALIVALWGIYQENVSRTGCDCLGSLQSSLTSALNVIRGLIVVAASLVIISCFNAGLGTDAQVFQTPTQKDFVVLVTLFFSYLLFKITPAPNAFPRKSNSAPPITTGRTIPQSSLQHWLQRLELRHSHSALLFTLPECQPCVTIMRECSLISHLIKDRLVIVSTQRKSDYEAIRTWEDPTYELSKLLEINTYPTIVEINRALEISFTVTHGADRIRERLLSLLASSAAEYLN